MCWVHWDVRPRRFQRRLLRGRLAPKAVCSSISGRWRVREASRGEARSAAERYPWLDGGTTLQHAGRTEPAHVTRADAHHWRDARLPPGGVQGWRACVHTPSRVAPPVGRHLLPYLCAHRLHLHLPPTVAGCTELTPCSHCLCRSTCRSDAYETATGLLPTGTVFRDASAPAVSRRRRRTRRGS